MGAHVTELGPPVVYPLSSDFLSFAFPQSKMIWGTLKINFKYFSR